MYLRDYLEVPAEPAGADGLTARWVINATQGATNFAMCIYELQPGKNTPFHQHEHEHQLFIFEGCGQLITPQGVAELRPGSAVFIPSGEQHQFINNGEAALRMVGIMPFASTR
ncbi:MAG: cupin domain-containing protein [Anaerolineae bacterium]|nr:MAG: cupin domain-containing protein [Anaerolineae bacterium]